MTSSIVEPVTQYITKRKTEIWDEIHLNGEMSLFHQGQLDILNEIENSLPDGPDEVDGPWASGWAKRFSSETNREHVEIRNGRLFSEPADFDPS